MAFQDGFALYLLILADDRGIKLSPNVRHVAGAFGAGGEALHTFDVWTRLTAAGHQLSRSTVYRAFAVLEEKGLIKVSAVVASRTYFQVDRPIPLIHLVDMTKGQLQTIVADDIALRIMTLVREAGYELAGGLDIRVIANGQPVSRKGG